MFLLLKVILYECQQVVSLFNYAQVVVHYIIYLIYLIFKCTWIQVIL